jgi:hypothetical protein
MARIEESQNGFEVGAEANVPAHVAQKYVYVVGAHGYADVEIQTVAARPDGSLGMEVSFADAALGYVEVEVFVRGRARMLFGRRGVACLRRRDGRRGEDEEEYCRGA